MLVTYVIDNTSGMLDFQIAPGELNGPGGVEHLTDLRLYGNGALRWGEGVDENLLRLVENFACPEKESDDNPPPGTLGKLWPKGEEDKDIDNEFQKGPGRGINKPVSGQIWFNTTDEVPYIFSQKADNGNGKWLHIGTKDYFCGTTAICGTLDFKSSKCPDDPGCVDQGIITGAKIIKSEVECYIRQCGLDIPVCAELNFNPTNCPDCGPDCVKP